MAVEQFANDAATVVSSGGSTTPAQGTQETWTVSAISSFPVVSNTATPTTQFHITDPANPTEIMTVINVSGGGNTTWLVVRGAEGTTPVSHTAGFTVKQVLTANSITQLQRVDWLNVVTMFGADPTGITDSTTAITNALAACPAGGIVFIPAGKFTISSPLNIPTGVWMRGNQGFRAAARNVSYIEPSAGFSGAAAITFSAGTPAGALENIVLNGTNLPGGNTVDGIDLLGGVKQWSLIGCAVQHFGGHGVNITASGGNPDGGYIRDLHVNNNGLDGLHWAYCVDSLANTVHADSNGNSGVYFANLNNTSVYGMKSQSNTQYGYNFNVSFGKPSGIMVGCFSENNQLDGFHVTALSNAGTITFIGCGTNNDGNAGVQNSGYSGFNMTSSGVDLMFQGCFNFITTTANGPDYGMKLTNATGQVTFTGCSFLGANAGYLDGGGNTSVSWIGTTTSFGESDSRTVASPTLATTGPALGTPKASDFGAIAWACDPAGTLSSGGTTAVNGTVYLTAVFVPQICTINKILWMVKTAAITPTTSQNFLGIYNAAGTLLNSVNVDTASTSVGFNSTTITATIVTPGMYWVAMVFNAATPPVLQSTTANGTSTGMGLGVSASLARFATSSTAQTSLPGTITPASNARTAGGMWAAVSS